MSAAIWQSVTVCVCECVCVDLSGPAWPGLAFLTSASSGLQSFTVSSGRQLLNDNGAWQAKGTARPDWGIAGAACGSWAGKCAIKRLKVRQFVCLKRSCLNCGSLKCFLLQHSIPLTLTLRLSLSLFLFFSCSPAAHCVNPHLTLSLNYLSFKCCSLAMAKIIVQATRIPADALRISTNFPTSLYTKGHFAPVNKTRNKIKL